MSALTKFSEMAARRYLQSAVFVDDHIFDHKTGMPTLPVEALPQRKPIYRRAVDRKATNQEQSSENNEGLSDLPYHPKDLVSSFAKEGIICALYEPREDFTTDTKSEIFKLCERPDIIILDWDFSGDNGTKVLELIAALVKQSAEYFPHHTRLISVYTADQSLVAVANKIADRLKKDGLDATPKDEQCRLQSGATRLLVLGKPIDRFGEEEVKFTVKESALACKLIDEFVAMNTGILSAYALHGLAAIRSNSKRILDRFHGDLDGAFLLHRELISGSEEGFDQLPELLAEEIRAVVDDECISAGVAKKISAAALKSHHVSKRDKDLVLSFQKGTKPKNVVGKLNEAGGVPIGHLRLAALFSSRTQYSPSSKRLGFGTIVRFRAKNSKTKNTPWQHAVCLVPTCDSLRLKPDQHVSFPFWTIEMEGYNGNSRRNALVLARDSGEYISLSVASGKAGDRLWTDSFSVDKKTRTVIAFRERGVYKYGGAKRTIEWLGELKPLHAHRIVHEITDNLSRVGVNEAEWLRLLCDRQ